MSGFLQTLLKLGPMRLVALAAVGLGVLGFFVFFTGRLSVEPMTVLYGDLDMAESGRIVSKIESMGVPFELAPDGRRIMVPASRAARVRMALAEEGLPAGGTLGYELFDKQSALGTTSFAQRINHLRALEGELARSIRTLGPVKGARVHLVLPKREVFSRDVEEPSASIILNLQGVSQLTRAQVQAIQNLVASAVPKLAPNRVSIIDDRGNLLARGGDHGDPTTISAQNAEEMRKQFEARMARSIEGLLERSVGFGKVRAEVSAELDFDRVTTNSETFDPDRQVVRSTQTVTEQSASTDGAARSSVTVANNLPDAEAAETENGKTRSDRSSREEETVNYEISKTVQTHVRESGAIRRITAAVLVDGRLVVGPDGARSYEPRSAEDIAKLTALVKTAIGFSEERGDRIEVVNMQFARPDEDLAADATDLALLGFSKQDYFRMAELAILGVVALLVILLVVRPVLGRILDAMSASAAAAGLEAAGLQPALAGPAGIAGALPAPEAAADDEAMIDISQVEGRVKASSVRQIGEIIERHPDEALGIMRQWMYQD